MRIVPGLQQCQSSLSAYRWRYSVQFCLAHVHYDLACNMHISCTIMENHVRCNYAGDRKSYLLKRLLCFGVALGPQICFDLLEACQ